MPQGQSHPNSRRDAVEVTEEMEDGRAEPPTKKRRIFLQTMGQQLREVGVGSGDATSPYSRGLGRRESLTPSLNDCPSTGRPQVRQIPIQTPESDAVPGEDDQLSAGAMTSASKTLWQQGEVLANPATDGSDTFTFDDLIAWSRSYFDHWHPAYPFLHAPSVLESFNYAVKQGVRDLAESSPHKLTIIRSIMSISLADRRQTRIMARPVPSQLVFTSFNAAVQSIQCLLIEETSILSLQAVVSVQLLLISMLRYNAASRLEGLAARMAFHLGLHRCPMQFSAFPRKDAELRQRLFWSMYCIDRYICIRLGVPLAIRDSEIDTCFLTSERHGDAAHELEDNDNRLDLLRFLAKHAEIRGSISELRNKSVLDKRTEIDETVVIGAELTRWWNEVEDYLESRSSGVPQMNRYHQVTLIVLRHESIIALNKHTLATSKLNSIYDAALQNCISASRSIVTTLHRALETNVGLQDSTPREQMDHSGLLWPSFTWAVWMSMFLVIYAANECQIPQDAAIRLSDRALEVLSHLTLRGSVWPNACAAAIRDLRAKLDTNRNGSKQGHRFSRNAPTGSMQSELISQEQLGFPSHQSNYNGELRASSKTKSQREQQNFPNLARPVVGTNQAKSHLHQDRSNSQNFGNLQEIDREQSSQHHQPASMSNMAHSQFTNRPPWIFTEPTPTFGLESAGYAYRYGPQSGIVPELQLPNWAGSELLYDVDTPFWTGNDQWMGMGMGGAT